jgi:peptide deformylase
MKKEIDLKQLRKVSTTATLEEAKEIVKKLKVKFQEMKKEAHGITANQIGIFKRVFYVNLGGCLLGIVNPEVIEVSEEKSSMREGCLSLPKTRKKEVLVERPERIKIKFLDTDGDTHIMEFTGLSARIIQHEIDHLNGKLIID